MTRLPNPGELQRGLLVDSTAQRVVAVTFDNIGDLHRLLDGYLEAAYAWPNGDVLYVDEEGLLKGRTHFFWLAERRDQLFAGNGVLVGREHENDTYPNGYVNCDPTLTIEELRARVRFAEQQNGGLKDLD